MALIHDGVECIHFRADPESRTGAGEQHRTLTAFEGENQIVIPQPLPLYL
jgi:hypothetical protein